MSRPPCDSRTAPATVLGSRIRGAPRPVTFYSDLMPKGQVSASMAEERRDQVLEAVTNYINEHQISPSMAEIAETTGQSETAVARHVRTLVAQGRLLRGHGHRTIRLIN